ncbi:NAD(P)/FAD-dependent oxidoreductase [Altererythrobacter sp. BO-6]|uniref:NAD(P)/FAD-dependent oxidoreductase n=1 Tax=Altererythrobacter sp. BO-6 TaxID=2604537 RepID=UPI0013E10EF5|nr:NAD(P)/FAD-dependent oxidoreductase [Altererythrobacter sp. BO-6]QIG53200.1 NAD(P)/FAD-dependent oxidoreductase [Altererythrobacter sp. BO-6]
MEEVECIVVGGGVIGLACAAALARSGREVVLLEAEQAIGTHSSSRNSEVIHAGIYYEPESLKAKFCRRGRDMLYAFAADRGIAHRRIGKAIVATSNEQLEQLEEIRTRAVANDVHDLQFLSRNEMKSLEPEVQCVGALYSPSTGIIDSHGLMVALEGEFEHYGGMLVLKAEVTAVIPDPRGFVVEINNLESERLRTRNLVNCAGLRAVEMAQRILGARSNSIPDAYFAIGHYYRLSGRPPCKRLVYPIPVTGGLGVHLTIDLGGQARFGPDVRWIEKPDYRFDDCAKDDFVSAIQCFLPNISADQLQPDYTGVRSKISGPDRPAADFRIDGPDDHGVTGLINLFGIESPGLTSSLAIADYVVRRL